MFQNKRQFLKKLLFENRLVIFERNPYVNVDSLCEFDKFFDRIFFTLPQVKFQRFLEPIWSCILNYGNYTTMLTIMCTCTVKQSVHKLPSKWTPTREEANFEKENNTWTRPYWTFCLKVFKNKIQNHIKSNKLYQNQYLVRLKGKMCGGCETRAGCKIYYLRTYSSFSSPFRSWVTGNVSRMFEISEKQWVINELNASRSSSVFHQRENFKI